MHSTHAHAAAGVPEGAAGATLAVARDAFGRAAAATPRDADVHTALGVIAHLAGDYAQAASAFEAALALRPEDYSLWNKLGATLANSGRSDAAKGAYAHALRHKPNYMRAWSNLGIAHSNLGEYAAAAQYFLKALRLNGGADAVWGYLQTALVMMGAGERLAQAHARDVEGLIAALGVAEGLQEPGMATSALGGVLRPDVPSVAAALPHGASMVAQHSMAAQHSMPARGEVVGGGARGLDEGFVEELAKAVSDGLFAQPVDPAAQLDEGL
jgi:tetratricopeptide (TPR) repeat protein